MFCNVFLLAAITVVGQLRPVVASIELESQRVPKQIVVIDNPCAFTLCVVNTTCLVIKGKAACVSTKPRPGKCPSNDVINTCQFDPNINCLYDSQCGYGERCCPYGCSSICQRIVQGSDNLCARKNCGVGYLCDGKDGSCVALPPKSGQCPAVLSLQLGNCFWSDCNNDYNCNGTLKCCPNGCTNTCQSPVSADPKPGTCPVPPPGTATPCIATCSNDGQCPGSQKCCNYGCGITCKDPVPVANPGQCPPIVPGQPGICAITCNSDSSCASTSQKCCPTACGGQVCQTAVQSLPPSCSSITCPANQTCVLKDVICVRAPCYPVPTCVDNLGCTNYPCPPNQVCVERTVPCFRGKCPVLPQCIKVPRLPPALCVGDCPPDTVTSSRGSG